MAQLKPGVGVEEIAAQCDRMANAILALNHRLKKAEAEIESLRGENDLLQAKIRRLER